MSVSRDTSCDARKAPSLVEINSYLPFMFFLASVYLSAHIFRTVLCAKHDNMLQRHIAWYEQCGN